MALSRAHVTEGLAAAGSVRAARDRFVAFAFCAADILLELDSKFRVTYAGGATTAMTGRPADELVGASAFDLVPDHDRDLLRRLLERAIAGERLEHTGIRLIGPDGPTFPMHLLGYYLPDLDGRYFLALRMDLEAPASLGTQDVTRDTESGLLETDAFAKIGQERLREARQRGDNVLMTVFDFENLVDLRSRLDLESQRELMFTLGDYLKANSVGGDSAGRLGDDRYGLLHNPNLDVDVLQKRIGDLASRIDPEGDGIAVERATVNIDSDALSDEDAAKVLVYAINRFDKREKDGLTVAHISDGLSGAMEETAQRIGDLREVIATRGFDIAFQPIVDLATRRGHHFEALVRFDRNDHSVSPLDLIRFAEEVGLIGEFDLAMCRRVIDWLDTARQAGKDFSVAVNLSGRSLTSLDFIAELLSLLQNNRWTGDHLLFELTESANIDDLERVNKVIQGIRKLGCKVCLDDFGAGESAFHYLRALQVDIVKIDGSYVREARTVAKDRVFLKSIAGLCDDLGVATVAEMVEDEETITLLRKCGVKFGQGNLFGRPSLDITAFDVERSAGQSAEARRRARG